MPQVQHGAFQPDPVTGQCVGVRGDYIGPEKNSAPNPGGYWWGCVLVKDRGVVHVQEVGKKKTWEKMVELGAKK